MENESMNETSSSDALGKLAKYQLSASLKSSLVDLPEVLTYIEKLQKVIERCKKRLKKLSTKRKKTKDSSTQTDQQQLQSQPHDPQSIAQEIAEAAEQAVLKTGMVYEESSGLYYDYKTGYYYNAEYGLYYDGATGTYMTYDATADTYHFYSKVDVPAAANRGSDKGDQAARSGGVGRVGETETSSNRRKKRYRRGHKDGPQNVNDDDNSGGGGDTSSVNRLPRKRHHRNRSRSPDDCGQRHHYYRQRPPPRERDRRHRSERSNNLEYCYGVMSDDASVDLEEGECSEDENALVIALSEEDDDEKDESEMSDTRDIDGATDITKQYPPCIRIVVEESNVRTVRKGALFMVPYTGGTLGREGSTHAILLPDLNVSKHHLQFRYDEEQKRYFVCDLGSRNGTLLNGTRMAPSKQESDRMELVHGSRLQIGGTILLCHIHTGAQTCGHCEPGLIQGDPAAAAVHPNVPSKSEQHKNELKQLRRKFGISQYEVGKVEPGPGYTNRAQNRRFTVGSSNPHEKTQVACLTESIPIQNKGFKMLAKMGWTEGTSLGKDGTGRIEPVALVSNPGTSGMGSGPFVQAPLPDPINHSKPTPTSIKWLKTKERYDKLPDKAADVRDKLGDNDDNDDDFSS